MLIKHQPPPIAGWAPLGAGPAPCCRKIFPNALPSAVLSFGASELFLHVSVKRCQRGLDIPIV